MIALQNLLNERHTPSIISVSYGVCEPQNGRAANAAIKAAYLQAVLEGVSVFVATGDAGAADCDFVSGTGGTGAADAAAVFGLAADGYNTTPYNVSVGGTDFADLYLGTVANYWASTNSPTYGSALSYVPEIPWNDSCAGSLNASFFGFTYSYGPEGFCNNPSALAPDPALGGNPEALLLTWAGGGGPGACATGVPAGGSNSNAVVSGTCRGAAKPWWQKAKGNPHDGVRDLPDISMFAANGIWGHYFVVCYSDPTPRRLRCSLCWRSHQLGWRRGYFIWRSNDGWHPGTGEPEVGRPAGHDQARAPWGADLHHKANVGTVRELVKAPLKQQRAALPRGCALRHRQWWPMTIR